MAVMNARWDLVGDWFWIGIFPGSPDEFCFFPSLPRSGRRGCGRTEYWGYFTMDLGGCKIFVWILFGIGLVMPRT
jgi:hypothetical protein